MDRDTIITTIWVVCVLLALVYFMVRKKAPVMKPGAKVKFAKQILIFNLSLISLSITTHFIKFLRKPDVSEFSYQSALLILAIFFTSWWTYMRELKKRQRALMELSQYPLTYEDQMVKYTTASIMGEDDVAQEAHARAIELQSKESEKK